MTYYQEINAKSPSLPERDHSVDNASNEFYSFANDGSSIVTTQKYTTPNSNHPPESSTFWTSCSHCRVRGQYLRVYLDHNLLCPKCEKPFLALETGFTSNGHNPSLEKSERSTGDMATTPASTEPEVLEDHQNDPDQRQIGSLDNTTDGPSIVETDTTCPQKSSTFWTSCNHCRVRYEYLRIYQNRNLCCPKCLKAFLAVETGFPSNGHKYNPSSEKSKGSTGTANTSASTEPEVLEDHQDDPDQRRKGSLIDNTTDGPSNVETDTTCSQKSSTFWTSCNHCRVWYEYLRIYQNRNLRCPKCLKAFLAVEMGFPSNGHNPFSKKSKRSAGTATTPASTEPEVLEDCEADPDQRRIRSLIDNTTDGLSNVETNTTCPQKSSTFWTSCNHCRVQYEYHRIYKNRNLCCRKCLKVFLAVETGFPANGHIPSASVKPKVLRNFPADPDWRQSLTGDTLDPKATGTDLQESSSSNRTISLDELPVDWSGSESIMAHMRAMLGAYQTPHKILHKRAKDMILALIRIVNESSTQSLIQENNALKAELEKLRVDRNSSVSARVSVEDGREKAEAYAAQNGQRVNELKRKMMGWRVKPARLRLAQRRRRNEMGRLTSGNLLIRPRIKKSLKVVGGGSPQGISCVKHAGPGRAT